MNIFKYKYNNFRITNVSGNAIHHAKTPVMDKLCSGGGYTTLNASGLSVGLPDGLMGNSEVGHLNIGAGRIVYQVNCFVYLNFFQRHFYYNLMAIHITLGPIGSIS